MQNNFFTINRKFIESDMWLKEKFTKGQAWIDLVGLANWADKKTSLRGIEFTVKRGQVGRSERFLAKRWGWSRNKVRRFLNGLENEQRIAPQKNNVTSLINITNYDRYQLNGTTNDTTNGTTNDTTKGEGKEDKEDIPPKPPISKSPTLEEVKKYFLENGYSEDGATAAHEYYSELNWHNSKNKPVKVWKTTMRNNWFRDKYKIVPKVAPKSIKQLKQDEIKQFGRLVTDWDEIERQMAS